MRPHVDGFSSCKDEAGSVAVIGEPSSDLLDRALVGWERFLSTLKREADE